MIRGIYASASSLFALLRRQESLSHNLANMNTPGFKQEAALLETGVVSALVRERGGLPAPAVGALPAGVDGADLLVDYTQGPLESTQRPFDLAILGDGFFRVQTPDGERLTRDGTFQRDAAGHLATADGYLLLGADNNPIQIGEGSPTITEDGSIYMPGATQPIARIGLAAVDNPANLQREDRNLLSAGTATVTAAGAGTSVIKQGLIEQSKVDASTTMIGMMTALRSYEATQRMMKLQDETLQRMLEIGRPGGA